MTSLRQILTTSLVILTAWVDPLVRQVSASSSVAGQVCDYTLQAEVCVGHRYQDQGNNSRSSSALSCDRLAGNIKVMVNQDMSLLYVPELDFQWRGSQQQQPMVAGQLEFTAQKVGDDDIQFRSSREIESGRLVCMITLEPWGAHHKRGRGGSASAVQQLLVKKYHFSFLPLSRSCQRKAVKLTFCSNTI